jgi:hypothetical protein
MAQLTNSCFIIVSVESHMSLFVTIESISEMNTWVRWRLGAQWQVKTCDNSEN